MKLAFDDQALADFEDIFEWIAQDSPATARFLVERLFSSTELLISFPFMGGAGRDPDTFELAVQRLPYIVLIRPCNVLSLRLSFTAHRTARATSNEARRA